MKFNIVPMIFIDFKACKSTNIFSILIRIKYFEGDKKFVEKVNNNRDIRRFSDSKFNHSTYTLIIKWTLMLNFNFSGTKQ